MYQFTDLFVINWAETESSWVRVSLIICIQRRVLAPGEHSILKMVTQCYIPSRSHKKINLSKRILKVYLTRQRLTKEIIDSTPKREAAQ